MIRRVEDFWEIPGVKGFMEEHRKRETARRTICPECQFESSEGYPESHTSNCSKRPANRNERVHPKGR